MRRLIAYSSVLSVKLRNIRTHQFVPQESRQPTGMPKLDHTLLEVFHHNFNGTRQCMGVWCNNVLLDIVVTRPRSEFFRHIQHVIISHNHVGIEAYSTKVLSKLFSIYQVLFNRR